MKVSIITVTYNNAATLADTIESVYQQTYQDIEYWIIDGASDDCTLDIIHENVSVSREGYTMSQSQTRASLTP